MVFVMKYNGPLVTLATARKNGDVATCSCWSSVLSHELVIGQLVGISSISLVKFQHIPGKIPAYAWQNFQHRPGKSECLFWVNFCLQTLIKHPKQNFDDMPCISSFLSQRGHYGNIVSLEYRSGTLNGLQYHNRFHTEITVRTEITTLRNHIFGPNMSAIFVSSHRVPQTVLISTVFKFSWNLGERWCWEFSVIILLVLHHM